MPLFLNEERAEIGTLYKKEGQEIAILRGLDIIGPKMSSFVRKAQSISKDNKVIIHCWRGGKRSGSVSWLLSLMGMEVYTLEGGYKAYRKFIRKDFSEKQSHCIILTGSTGSGKTQTLHYLKERGEQIIDLEAIAHHKGSAFGDIGEQQQPTPEQFENNLYEAFRLLDFNRRIWLESESRMIGNIPLPDTFWEMMNQSKMIHLQISRTARIQYLVNTYGQYPNEALAQSFQKLRKKLAQHLNAALEALDTNDLDTAANIALNYYDKYYQKHLDKNKDRIIRTIHSEDMDFNQICDELLNDYTG